MYTDNHEEVPNLPTKNFLTVVGDHLDGSSIRDGIDVPQFNYYGVHIVGPELDDYMLMIIGKNWDEEETY